MFVVFLSFSYRHKKHPNPIFLLSCIKYIECVLHLLGEEGDKETVTSRNREWCVKILRNFSSTTSKFTNQHGRNVVPKR